MQQDLKEVQKFLHSLQHNQQYPNKYIYLKFGWHINCYPEGKHDLNGYLFDGPYKLLDNPADNIYNKNTIFISEVVIPQNNTIQKNKGYTLTEKIIVTKRMRIEEHPVMKNQAFIRLMAARHDTFLLKLDDESINMFKQNPKTADNLCKIVTADDKWPITEYAKYLNLCDENVIEVMNKFVPHTLRKNKDLWDMIIRHFPNLWKVSDETIRRQTQIVWKKVMLYKGVKFDISLEKYNHVVWAYFYSIGENCADLFRPENADILDIYLNCSKEIIRSVYKQQIPLDQSTLEKVKNSRAIHYANYKSLEMKELTEIYNAHRKNRIDFASKLYTVILHKLRSIPEFKEILGDAIFDNARFNNGYFTNMMAIKLLDGTIDEVTEETMFEWLEKDDFVVYTDGQKEIPEYKNVIYKTGDNVDLLVYKIVDPLEIIPTPTFHYRDRPVFNILSRKIRIRISCVERYHEYAEEFDYENIKNKSLRISYVDNGLKLITAALLYEEGFTLDKYSAIYWCYVIMRKILDEKYYVINALDRDNILKEPLSKRKEYNDILPHIVDPLREFIASCKKHAIEYWPGIDLTEIADDTSCYCVIDKNEN